MIHKTLTFINALGNEVTRDTYFGLTKAEYLHLEADWASEGGIEGYLDIVKRGDNPKLIMDTFRELIGRSYGERRGENFVKTPEITAGFLASEAYSEVLIGLVQGDWDAAEFIRGILPKVEEKTAREKSEERMQGFQKKQESTFQPAPELNTAEPVLTENTQQPADMSEFEQFQAWKAQQGQ